MKRNFILIITILSIFFIGTIPTFAANEDYRIFYTFDKESYSVGEDVKVTLSLENRSGDNFNMRNFSDVIIYNKEFLEFVEVSDIAENFSVTDRPVSYNTQYDKITARYQYLQATGTPPERNQKFDVCTVTFKALAETVGTLYHAETSVWIDPYIEESVLAETKQYTIGNPKMYTAHFSGGDGAQGTVESISAKTGDTIVLPENKFIKDGKSFDGWKASDVTYPEGKNYVMGASDVTFTAQWTDDKTIYYVISTSAEKGGKITETTRVAKDGSITIKITPDTGYKVSDVIVDNESVGAVTQYAFNNVDANHTVTAKFVQSSTGGNTGGSGTSTTDPQSTQVPTQTMSPTMPPEYLGEVAYYVLGGQEIFVGFSLDKEYIAPEGAEVLFKQNTKNFSDVSPHWAEDYIKFVTQRELFLGVETNRFGPEEGMTRAMFATVIGRLYERSYGMIEDATVNPFDDVSYDEWYGKYIKWASDNGIVNGTGNGLFSPDREISREEMSVLVYRFADFLDMLPEGIEGEQLRYVDSNDISSWAVVSAKYMSKTGIISGNQYGEFSPQKTATRAEVSKIITVFIENILK